ncbi:MAG: glycosyltransferase family 25 protein [Nanoarchaeota archaeon]|nr:glycosyltransferase family 25 protein [Nanoarchaeota archaeon]
MRIKYLDKIYILHYAPLKERKVYLERRLNELGLESYSEWITSEKDEKFEKKELSFYDPSEKALKERRRVLGHNWAKIGRLDIIMNLQHLNLLKRIATKNSNKVSMVCEDDILLEKDFPEKLSLTIKKLSKIKWDICYTDKGALFVEPKKVEEELFLYFPKDRRSNTTGSYLITGRSAKKFVRLRKNFSISPDNEMSFIQKKYKMRVCWALPFLTHQGSIEKVYVSNVRTGTLTGDFLRIIKKIDRVSPMLARYVAKNANRLRNAANESRILGGLKKIVKDYKKYSISS